MRNKYVLVYYVNVGDGWQLTDNKNNEQDITTQFAFDDLDFGDEW